MNVLPLKLNNPYDETIALIFVLDTLSQAKIQEQPKRLSLFNWKQKFKEQINMLKE